MKVRLFAIRLVSEKFISDQKVLNDFLENVDFVKSDTHFIESEINYWSVLVHFEDKKTNFKSEEKGSKKVVDILEADLDAHQLENYNKLRNWRTKKAQDWGIPSYMICHNSEFLQVVLKKPKTISDLKMIKGFGDLKIENHGEEILDIINAT
jgi:superfamily II DNA helicase RecQ